MREVAVVQLHIGFLCQGWIFLRIGWTEQFLNWSAKTPVDRDRLMIFVIEGRTDLHCFRSEVGIGSRSQEVSGELDKSAENSSIVARWKQGIAQEVWKLEADVVRKYWVPDRIEDQSSWILSEKNVANDWGKEFRVKRWRKWRFNNSV